MTDWQEKGEKREREAREDEERGKGEYYVSLGGNLRYLLVLGGYPVYVFLFSVLHIVCCPVPLLVVLGEFLCSIPCLRGDVCLEVGCMSYPIAVLGWL